MVVRNLFTPGSATSAFSSAEIAQLLAAGRTVLFSSGERILTRDERGSSMFVLLQGEVEILLPSGPRVMSVHGSYFGELSFINPDHRRSATINALTPVQACKLDQQSIELLTACCPRVLVTLMRRTCAVLVNKEETLSGMLEQRNQELRGTLDYLRRTREELDHQELLAQTDPLTGLYNRRCFDSQVERFLDRTADTDEGLALIYIDLDHFKPINDTLGHGAGDEVLRAIGRLLRKQVRRTDLPVRLGGDEFAVVLLDVTAEQARARAEHIRSAIAALSHPGQEHGLPLTASLGGTLYRTGEGRATFIERADRALYAAKESGRNAMSWS